MHKADAVLIPISEQYSTGGTEAINDGLAVLEDDAGLHVRSGSNLTARDQKGIVEGHKSKGGRFYRIATSSSWASKSNSGSACLSDNVANRLKRWNPSGKTM